MVQLKEQNKIFRSLILEFIIIITLIILVEYLINEFYPLFYAISPLDMALYRMVALLITLFPIVYFLVFKPMKKYLQALKKSEERFYKAFNNNPNPFVITRSNDFQIVNINEAFLNLFEFKREEVVGHYPEELHMFPFQEKYDELISEIKKQGYLKKADIEMQTKTKKPLRISVNAQMIDIDGENYIVTNLIDVTELKRAEYELKQSREQYRNLLYELNEGFCLIEMIFDDLGNAIDFRFLEVNPEYERQTGDKNVTGKLRSEIPRKLESEGLKIYGRIAKTGIAEHFESEAKSLERHFEVYSYRVGNSNKVAILLNDITNRKKAEEELRRSEIRHRSFFESGLIGVVFWNMDGRITDANEKYLEITGFSHEEIKQGFIFWNNIIAGEHSHFIKEKLRELPERGRIIDPQEIEICRKDGQRISILFSAAILDETEKEGIAFALDISEKKKWEIKLKQSEERFSKAFFKSPIAASILNSNDQKFVVINSKFLEIFKLKEEEAVGHTPAELNLYKDIRQREELLNLLNYQEDVLNQEIQMISKTGKELYILVSYRKIQMEGIPHIYVNYVDITDRKKAQEELRQSEERFRALTMATSQAIYLMSPDWEYMKTLSSGGFLAQTDQQKKTWLNEYIPEDTRDEMIETIRKAIENKSTFELEHKVILNDGTVGWAYSRAVPILDKEGNILEWFGTAIDITDRKVYEKALQASERLWVTTLTSINEAVIVGDPGGKVIFMNAEAECLTGWNRNEALKRPVCDIYCTIDEFSRKFNEDPVKKILKSKSSYREKDHTLLIRKQGDEIPIEESGAPIKNGDEKISGIVLVFHDVSEHKQLEKQLKEYSSTLEERVRERTNELSLAKEQAESADKMKTSFLLTMSHELRTPLNSIIGFSGILQKQLAGPLNEEQKKQTYMIQQSGRHLLHLVNDILDMSKIEVGQLEVHFELFDVGNSLEQVIDIEKSTAENKGLSLQLNRPKEEIIAESDSSRFQQVILNLVHNAVKFTSQGSVTVEYWIEENEIIINVSDTGIGIKEENIPKLFVSFAQLQDDALVRRHPGTGSGLGLAISKKIMDLLHGSIDVKSEYGKGSIFTVTLPISAKKQLAV
jgi:PAS domain S-box-containing protein